MAKEKKTKTKAALPNKNVHLRLAFLAQAAEYLNSNEVSLNVMGQKREIKNTTRAESQRQVRYLTGQMRSIGRKSVIRLSQQQKHQICKVCDQLLIPGQTATTSISNSSKNGKKSWADIEVITCNACCSVKRFPVGKTLQQQAGNH